MMRQSWRGGCVAFEERSAHDLPGRVACLIRPRSLERPTHSVWELNVLVHVRVYGGDIPVVIVPTCAVTFSQRTLALCRDKTDELKLEGVAERASTSRVSS